MSTTPTASAFLHISVWDSRLTCATIQTASASLRVIGVEFDADLLYDTDRSGLIMTQRKVADLAPYKDRDANSSSPASRRELDNKPRGQQQPQRARLAANRDARNPMNSKQKPG